MLMMKPALRCILALLVFRVGASSKVPAEVTGALACLMTAEWVQQNLSELGLKTGSAAMIRYTSETIPGTSPNSRGILKVFVYDKSQTHAWLLFVDRTSDGLTILRNGYRLEFIRNRWSAGEGNGGVATYTAIGTFAQRVAAGQRVTRVILKPAAHACRVQD